jgi:cytochrome c556
MTPEERNLERQAIEASDAMWEYAEDHASKADWFIAEAEELLDRAREAATVHRTIAAAYLSLAGLGNSEDAHIVLGLPYSKGMPGKQDTP